jgi:hypothetical protein
MQLNPLREIEKSIIETLQNDLRIRSIIVPGGSDDTLEQLQESSFRAGWDRISGFSQVSSNPVILQATNCIFNVTLESKDLKLHNQAMDFILWAMFLLSGLKPLENIYPLIPVECGYKGYSYESGYSKYQLSLSTSFSWLAGEELNASPAIPPLEEIVSLILWTPIINPTTSEEITL